jgi:enoyl-CoA hydratase/carnithine racemase
MTELVRVEDDGRVRHLILNRAEKRNAFNGELVAAFGEAVRAVADDPDVHCVVVRGEGPSFSAGIDVFELGALGGQTQMLGAFRRACLEPVNLLEQMAKPTIAQIHGACLGLAAEIAVACDLRVGGSNLRIRFPGAALGIPVGPARLVTLCGLSVAKYLLLTAKEVGAEQALRWGLVHRVAPPQATEDATLELAAAVAAHPPEAIATLKRMLHRWDGVEDRSRDEGAGQVEWQRSGPEPPSTR